MHLIIVGVLGVALVAALLFASAQKRRSKPEPVASKPRTRIKLPSARRSQQPIEAIEVRASTYADPIVQESTVDTPTLEASTAEEPTVEESQQPTPSKFWTRKAREPKAKKVKEPKAKRAKDPKPAKERSRLSLRRRPKDPFEEAAVAAISDEPFTPPVPPIEATQAVAAVPPPPPPIEDTASGAEETLEPHEPVGADVTLELQALTDPAGVPEPWVAPPAEDLAENEIPPHEMNVPALHAVDEPNARPRRTVCSYCWHPNLGELDVCEKCGGQLRLIAI